MIRACFARESFPRPLLGVGVVALVTGAAMIHYRWHRTLGYGGLGIGVLFALVGAGLVVWTRRSPGASGGSKFRPFGGRGLPSSNRAKAIIAAAIIVGATLGTFVYSEYQLTSQSSGQFGIALNVDSASEVEPP